MARWLNQSNVLSRLPFFYSFFLSDIWNKGFVYDSFRSSGLGILGKGIRGENGAEAGVEKVSTDDQVECVIWN